MVTEIERCQVEVDRLQAELSSACEALHQAKLDAACVKVGDFVRATKNGTLYRVTEVDPAFGKAWVYGNPQRADGTFGTARRALYSGWELIEE